jgi:hypothetical protein
MNAQTILEELRPLGAEGYMRILLRHGAAEPCFGVKIEALKKIQKRIKRDYRLALDLYDTGNYDAMYLAGLIADDARMSRADLNRWVEKACKPLAGSTVPWVAAGSPEGWMVALEWIESDRELVAVAGWGTLCGIVSTREDAALDLAQIERLPGRVERMIHSVPNLVRYEMNQFVISVAAYVAPLTKRAKEAAQKIGRVTVDMGDTGCAVPLATEYIAKIEKRGAIGKKRKSAKC